MKKLYAFIVSSITLIVLSSCGGSANKDTKTVSVTPNKGMLTIGVTDDPVDDAARVVLSLMV